MKGVSWAFGALGALLIVVIILFFATKGTGNVFADKRAETEIAAMGLRNAIIQASLTENGKVISTMPGNDEYSLSIDSEKTNIQYAGQTTPSYKPLITMRHYTAGVNPASLTGKEFCIVNKKNPDDGCKYIIEICLPDDACCKNSFESAIC